MATNDAHRDDVKETSVRLKPRVKLTGVDLLNNVIAACQAAGITGVGRRTAGSPSVMMEEIGLSAEYNMEVVVEMLKVIKHIASTNLDPTQQATLLAVLSSIQNHRIA